MNYSNAWYEYLTNIQRYLQQQDKKVKDLEQRITQMESNHSNANHTTIEKLEYHFDQLKIERLDGTLHIGVTPEDLSKIDDLSLNQQPITSFQQPNSFQQQQVSQLDSYLTEQGPGLLNQLSNQYNYPIDQTYQEMLLNDVRKQLPERIAYYEKSARNNDSIKNDYELPHFIYEQVKKEVTHSLHQFFQNDRPKGEQ